MAKSKKKHGLEMVRDYSIKYYGEIIDGYELLGKYLPDSMVQWIDLRKSVFREPPAGALTMREKELIATTLEITKLKPDARIHARLAVKSGATPKDVAEVCAICILLGGMVTNIVSGQYALKAAEEEFESQKKVKAASKRRRK